MYSRALAKLARAPKNCISLPVVISDTQHAIDLSQVPKKSASNSSLSYWIALWLIEDSEQYSLNPVGNLVDQRIVKFGSGELPMLSNVWMKRKSVLVTNDLSASNISPTINVAQIGSPENNWL